MFATRTLRQALVDRAVARALADCGDYLLPEAVLREQVTLQVPRVLTAEVDDALRHLESARRILASDTEYGRKWRLSEAGRSWWEEVR